MNRDEMLQHLVDTMEQSILNDGDTVVSVGPEWINFEKDGKTYEVFLDLEETNND